MVCKRPWFLSGVAILTKFVLESCAHCLAFQEVVAVHRVTGKVDETLLEGCLEPKDDNLNTRCVLQVGCWCIVVCLVPIQIGNVSKTSVLQAFSDNMDVHRFAIYCDGVVVLGVQGFNLFEHVFETFNRYLDVPFDVLYSTQIPKCPPRCVINQQT